MNSRDLIAFYKKASTAELIDVLENQHDYQPQALEAVKAELASRHLTREEMDRAYEQWQDLVENKQRNSVRATILQHKIVSKGRTFLGRINPFDFSLPEEERIIRGVLLWSGIFLVYSIISKFSELSYLIVHGRAADQGFVLLPYFLLLISLLMFGFRKKPGWVGITFVLTTGILSFLPAFWHIVTQRSTAKEPFIPMDQPSAIDALIPMIVISVTIYALCKPGVRDVFRISKSTMIVTFVFSLVASILLYISFPYGF